MNAKQINASHRRLFTDGGSLSVLYGYEQLTEEGRELARRRGENPCPVCDCWDCGELRPDDLDPCPTCGAECVPF